MLFFFGVASSMRSSELLGPRTIQGSSRGVDATHFLFQHGNRRLAQIARYARENGRLGP